MSVGDSKADELEATILQELLRWDGVAELPDVSQQLAKVLRTRVLSFLGRQIPEEFERPILTVDVVMFTLIEDRLHVLLPKRVSADPPEFEGMPALVGGYIHTQEDKDTYAAARRVCRTKIDMDVAHLEQLAVFSGPNRDPRGWAATMAYIAMVKSSDLGPNLLAEFYPVDSRDSLRKKIAFDHAKIIGWAVRRLRDKSSYSTLPLFLMPPKFTISELQQVYEALLGYEVEKAKFRRKIEDLIEPTDEFCGTAGRAARLFRAAKKKKLVFFDETI